MTNDIINRTCFEFSVSDQNLALQLKQEIDGLLYDKIIPRLEQLFEDYGPEEELLIVDYIELDLGDVSLSELESVLMTAIDSKILETIQIKKSILQLEEEIKTQDVTIKKTSRINRKIDALIHFLESGLLPWWNKDSQPEELLADVLQENPNKLFDYFIQSASSTTDIVWKRFFKQFSRNLIQRVFKQQDSSRYTIFKKLESDSEALELLGIKEDSFKKSIWQYVFQQNEDIIRVSDSVLKHHFEIQSLSATKPQIIRAQKKLFEKIKALPSSSPLKSSIENWDSIIHVDNKSKQSREELDETKVNEQKQPKSYPSKIKDIRSVENVGYVENAEDNRIEDILKEGIIIGHAGLVILSPFLSPFFKKISLVEGKSFVSEKAQEQAVLMCEFLISGNLKINENHALISKILCGFPINKPIDGQLKLSMGNQKEVESLLEAVIENWSALGKTSKAGLQSAFLQREGRIIETENRLLLKIERLGRDVLLDKLPWSIGIIRLPWMSKLLEVEW